MSTVLTPQILTATESIPLRNGDRLDQPTFHRRYLAMPEGFRAELVGGVVFVSSPVSRLHARYHARIMTILGVYELQTPGVELLDNGTVILDDENEPQPDAVLRIDEARGGRSSVTDDGYVAGAPELHVEVAYSSESIDLNGKRDAYSQAGVGEYLVVVIRDKTIRSFTRESDVLIDNPPLSTGVWKSQRFPGLWIDVAALFADRGSDLMQTIQQGLDSDEHRRFVERLQAE